MTLFWSEIANSSSTAHTAPRFEVSEIQKSYWRSRIDGEDLATTRSTCAPRKALTLPDPHTACSPEGTELGARTSSGGGRWHGDRLAIDPTDRALLWRMFSSDIGAPWYLVADAGLRLRASGAQRNHFAVVHQIYDPHAICALARGDLRFLPTLCRRRSPRNSALAYLSG